MKLSVLAWKKSSHLISAIKEHPFNQQLALGDLELEQFSYYIEQDCFYLKSFARSHAMIAAKISAESMRKFLKFAEYTSVAEQEIVHQFFKQKFGLQETGHFSSATLNYTNYLLATCALDAVEVAVAAVLPCFWVYREVGLSIVKYSHPHNPYLRWIETYSSSEFSNTVDEAIAIFDDLAEKTSPSLREKMLNAFYTSTCLEWHFWNDAYHLNKFDNVQTHELNLV